MKVLIADDDPDLRNALGAMTKRWGYEVVLTNDGLAAWQALQEGSPPLAILDWFMPGLSGRYIPWGVGGKAHSSDRLPLATPMAIEQRGRRPQGRRAGKYGHQSRK